MNIIKGLKKLFYIDYGTLEAEDKESVFDEFVEGCVNRINVLTAMIFFGECIIAIMDYVSGFFNHHSLNLLNLIGELIIIVASLITNAFCNRFVQKDYTNRKARLHLLRFYKYALLISVSLFIATDIIVRHKTIGAYIIFLFVFQVLPFLKPGII